MVVGHWLGVRNTERIMLAVREQDNVQLAQRVQEAGSAYVTALAALEKSRTTRGPAIGSKWENPSPQAELEIQQGREAALGSLYGAAIELSRLAPGDADIVRVLQILENRRFQEGTLRGSRQMIWF